MFDSTQVLPDKHVLTGGTEETVRNVGCPAAVKAGRWKVGTHSRESKEMSPNTDNTGKATGRTVGLTKRIWWVFFNPEDLYLSPRSSLKLWDVYCRLCTSISQGTTQWRRAPGQTPIYSPPREPT